VLVVETFHGGSLTTPEFVFVFPELVVSFQSQSATNVTLGLRDRRDHDSRALAARIVFLFPLIAEEMLMALNIGDPAPQITGTDVVSNQPWSLNDQAEKMVLLAFSGITWCGPCQAEAPALQAVWQELQGHPSFTMAIISGKFDGPEGSQPLQTAISNFGITFPVVPAHTSWPQYAINAVPTLNCLRWDAASNQYKVHGVHVGAMTQKQDIMDFLIECGLEDHPGLHDMGSWEAVFVMLFGGVIFGGGGWGVTPGGKPIPIDPPLPLRGLGASGREAVKGLALAEMASRIRDPEIRKRVRDAGIGTVKAAVQRLESRKWSSVSGAVSTKPSTRNPG
jgi:thiol-disulfide isomerase/thioredoxin